jgi:hypothetical protein
MCGQIAGVPSAAVHRSMNWMTEVWSDTSEVTQPPRVHGEISSSGTRKPSPDGSGTGASEGSRWNSPAVPAGGTGGGTWSNWPSFSS